MTVSANISFLPRKRCVWSWITFSITLETKGSKDIGRWFLGAVFEPFLSSVFDFAILQSGRNIEYFINKLQIWELGLAKTFFHLLKIFQIDYQDPQLYFHPNPGGVSIQSL